MQSNNSSLIESLKLLSHTQESITLLDNPILEKDIWNVKEDLNVKINDHSNRTMLNFCGIKQDYLKLLAKLLAIKMAQNKLKGETILARICYVKHFFIFLDTQSVYKPEQINDSVFEAYSSYLYSKGLKQTTISSHYSAVNNFFNSCREENWLNISTYWFKGRILQKVINNNEIEYIPEEIWNQLSDNLKYLPPPLQRMVLVIKTLGLRIGEVCNMPLDCLRKRGKKWHIRFHTEKYDIEDELPVVVPELVTIIKEQQEYIRQNLGDKFNKLFCTSSARHKYSMGDRLCWDFLPVPVTIKGATFNYWLNKLAKYCNISTKNGEIWHFTSHQFRRTVATIMENAGVRDLIIQKYLRHRSPDMQRHYTHLMKQVLADELEELMREKKYVDITGKVVASHKPNNVITEVMRRRLYQITTQYGECHRPSIKSPCPTVNSCWQCKDWRVSTEDLIYLKDDLKRVEDELNIANSMGMIRQEKGLKSDYDKLSNCIQALEREN